MRKKFFFGLIFIIGLTFLCGRAQAATTITGGSDFDSATAIQSGSYSGGLLAEGADQYFYVTLNQGQLLTVKTTFTTTSAYGVMNRVLLYNQDRNQLVEEFNANYSTVTLTASWLVNSDLASSRYYIMLDFDDDDTSSYSVTVSVENKYDANSTVDAPATFENPVTLTTGTSQGHLSGEKGDDTTDMFKLTPTVSGNYQIRITPSAEAAMTLTVLDAQREQIDQQYASNEGAILTSTFTADANSTVYVKVECDINCSSDLADYTIVTTSPTDTNTNTATVNTNTAVTNSNTNVNAVNGNVNAVNSNTNSVINVNNANVNANTNKTESEEDEGLSTTTILIIVGAAVIILLIIIIILVSRKKKTPPPASSEKK